MSKAEKNPNFVIICKFSEHLKSSLGWRVATGHWQGSLHPAPAHFVFLRFKIQPRNLEVFALFPTRTIQSQTRFLPTRTKGSFTVRTVISWLRGQVIRILLGSGSWSSEVTRSSQKPGPQQRCWPYLLSMLQSWSYSGHLGNTQSLQFPYLASPCLSAAGSLEVTKRGKKDYWIYSKGLILVVFF